MTVNDLNETGVITLILWLLMYKYRRKIDEVCVKSLVKPEDAS